MSLIPSIMPLVYWPDDRLHKKCVPVTEFGIELDQLVASMIATMDDNDGVGLSAPQVGVNEQLCIIRLEPQNTLVFINPTVTVLDETPYDWNEGCLSVPGFFTKRSRPVHIKIEYTDINHAAQELELVGLHAFAAQHEMDHLNGRVFVDNLSSFKKRRLMTKVKKKGATYPS